MSLGETVRKLAIKVSFSCLPWVALGALGAHVANATINKDLPGIEYCRKDLPTLAVLGGVLALGAVGTHVSRKKRVVFEPHKGIDRVFDYPGVLSSVSMAGLSGLAMANPNLAQGLQGLLNEDPVTTTSFLGALGACGWSFSYMFFDALSKLKSPCVPNFAKSIVLTAFNSGNRADYARRLTEILNFESAGNLEERARTSALRGNMTDAAYYWNAALNFEKRSGMQEILALSAFDSMARRIGGTIERISNYFKLRKNPNDRVLLIEKEFIHLLSYQPEKARPLAEKIISLPGCTDEEKILQSFVLDHVGAYSCADDIRNEIISKYQEDKPFRLGGNLIYVKTGIRENLVGESRRLLQLQRVSEKHGFEAARPLGIWDKIGSYCLLEAFSDGKRLYEMLEENPDAEIIRKAALAQAALHALVPPGQEKTPDCDITRFIDNEPLGIGGMDLGSALDSVLAPVWQYQAADCDGHRMNRYYNLNRQIVVFDLAPRGNAPLSFDYAKLLGQGRWPAHWQEQQEIIRESAEEYNAMVDIERRITPTVLQEHVFRSVPYKALRYAAFVWSKPEMYSTAISFLGNSENYIAILRNTAKVDNRACEILLGALRSATRALIEQSARRQPMTSH